LLRIESIRFEHNRILVKLNDGRTELRHLLNWPVLFGLTKENRNNYQIVQDRIFWPLIKFEISLTQILNARKK
jgi:hypothetical protein